MLSSFTLLYKHHHHPSPECSSSSQTETLSLTQRFPIRSLTQALATILLVSVSMDWTALATSHMGNHTIRVLLGLHDVHPAMRSSRGIQVVACVRTPLLLKAACIVLCVEGKVRAARLISPSVRRWTLGILEDALFKRAAL